MKDEFYVGWSDDTPKSYASKGKIFLSVVLLAMLSIAVVYVKNERGFIDSIYEFGELKELSGYLVEEPVWGLRIEESGTIKTIPLVGFGKMGPKWTLSKMMETHNLQEGTMVTLRGMVFHYQGKYWMELTEKENSLVNSGSDRKLDRNIEMKGVQELEGEIVDPKCFFGVMNPATKAIHRSCAIRCISGGIPPILAIRENGVFVDYYFVHGESMESIAMDLLPYIGVPVKLTGKIATYDDWKSIVINTKELELVMTNRKMESLTIATCN